VLSALCNFARLTRAQTAPRGEGSLLSWRRPHSPASREAWSRASLPLRLSLFALALAAFLPSHAQQGYALRGQAAPDFALHATAGGNVRLSEHRGDVVVLSFWSSRCYPCRAQLSMLNKSLATYRSAGLTIYGIGVDDDADKSVDFARSVAVGFALLLDPAKTVSRDYQVDSLPFTVLIDRTGNVRYALHDFSAASTGIYLQELRSLLNE
jgi:peroxiredoxin